MIGHINRLQRGVAATVKSSLRDMILGFIGNVTLLARPLPIEAKVFFMGLYRIGKGLFDIED
ncbi:hypothetical protein J41TS4_46580 [Paenibacillus apis]|uniref:Uncharacterized protein n=1 Tax=Paenibacillus apis TaxID=1792174 RepID=A0A919Y9L9_9BACL|nr:hypothetical protein J41TS4_46580 [Paenibacillus apis]